MRSVNRSLAVYPLVGVFDGTDADISPCTTERLGVSREPDDATAVPPISGAGFLRLTWPLPESFWVSASPGSGGLMFFVIVLYPPLFRCYVVFRAV